MQIPSAPLSAGVPMLQLGGHTNRTCAGVSRRAALQVGVLGGLGIHLPMLLGRRALASSQGLSAPAAPKARNCIVIWTHGGTSHHDTLDPKPLAPVSVKGEFSPIETAVPGVQFTEIMPRMAKELGRFGVLRSWNPQNASHGIAERYVLTGRNLNQSIHYPSVGSVVSYFHGFKSALPPNVQLGNHMDQTFGGGSAGILGIGNNPFKIMSDANQPGFTVQDLVPPTAVGTDRIGRRRQMLQTIESMQRPTSLQSKAMDVLDQQMTTAFDMITAPETRTAFRIDQEDPKLREAYGMTRLGQSLLLARRMIEAGVRCVTVTDPNWDTHANNFAALKGNLIPPVDQALPQLVIDLEQRGLLDDTLVVWLTDFGRTPQINSAGGRDHWATAGSLVFAGAGIPGGSVIGATDAEGAKPIRNEYGSEQVMATIYEKLGIPLDLHVEAPDGRPVRLLEAEPIREWV